MRSTAWLILLAMTAAANAAEVAGQLVTVVRDRTRVLRDDGTFDRFIPVGASFVVKAEKGEFVELQPADPNAPPELIEAHAVVPAKEADAFLRTRAERENSVTAWINLGIFLRRTQPDEHMKCFQKAGEIEWLNARLQTELGRSFKLSGNDEFAQRLYDTAVEIAEFSVESLKPDQKWFARSHTIGYPHLGVHAPAPRDFEVYLNCALGFNELWTGITTRERGKAAEKHFLIALGRDLNCTTAYCGLAEAYLAQGRRDDAIRALSAIIARRPSDHVHLIQRAELRERMGDFQLARQDFEKAIEVAERCTCALRKRAAFHERHRELRFALEDLDRASELEPGSTQILSQRIQIQASLCDYDGALADIQSLRRIAPNVLTQRPLEGMLWQLKGDFQKARQVYREFSVGRKDCCRMCMRQGDFASAIEDCDAIIADQRERIARSTRPGEKDAYSGLLLDARRARGYCLEQLGRLEEALADYSEWSHAKPADRVAHLSRSRVLKALGRDGESAAAIDRVMEMSKPSCTNYVARGQAKEVMGDLQGALEDYVAADRIHQKCGASLGSMAWMHATAADASMRSSARAVDEAERSIPLKGAPRQRKDVILAAAYAEAGNFDEAIRQIEKCMNARDSHEKRELMPVLDQYRKGIATRSEPWEVYLP